MTKFEIYPRKLIFRQPAGTSRGVYTERKVWYVVVRCEKTGRMGIGECAPLPDLSCDARADYAAKLTELCLKSVEGVAIDYEAFRPYPSMLFGVETALQHLRSGSFDLFSSSFATGRKTIQINGLIWMGSFAEMSARLAQKVEKGFRCIKIKIGAIDFERELQLIAQLRNEFCAKQIELRLDANGAFSPADALTKLDQLAKYDIHSVEQPIRAGQWKEMARICQQSPIDIALDEELIGINHYAQKAEMLAATQPTYIILKPSLHGGLYGSDEWIELANNQNIKWWATSALESNIGLNAIAQWAASKNPLLPQGLGTGQLFTTNAPIPLVIEGDGIKMNASKMPSTEEVMSFVLQDTL